MTSEDDVVSIYIIDTSSLVEMKRKYPKDVFPKLWQKMDDLISDGRLIAPTEVKEEIERVDDDLKNWADGVAMQLLKVQTLSFNVGWKIRENRA